MVYCGFVSGGELVTEFNSILKLKVLAWHKKTSSFFGILKDSIGWSKLGI